AHVRELPVEGLEKALACRRDGDDRRGSLPDALEGGEQGGSFGTQAGTAEPQAPLLDARGFEQPVWMTRGDDPHVSGGERPLAFLVHLGVAADLKHQRCMSV